MRRISLLRITQALTRAVFISTSSEFGGWHWQEGNRVCSSSVSTSCGFLSRRGGQEGGALRGNREDKGPRERRDADSHEHYPGRKKNLLAIKGGKK
ncbi:hypothetical protein E2C01_011755 [Portunus trituberculatus]|uniref:Uncharacterized protein n=1 Tax=Portunus trituberculatus TaxID=210409 RepID=A0A5B7DBV6_PORTR|nr:hypothetical protein [Portunus trituberculatus]